MDKYEVVFCIVNAGFSELVMDAAKEVGARGGTIINARGTANKEAEQFFHITIQPDKEIVMILVPSKIKDAVLHAVYNAAGLKTAGQGIAFSMAVENVVGLSSPTTDKQAGVHSPSTKPEGNKARTPEQPEDKREPIPKENKSEKLSI